MSFLAGPLTRVFLMLLLKTPVLVYFFWGGGKSPYEYKHKFGQYNAFLLCVISLYFPHVLWIGTRKYS